MIVLDTHAWLWWVANPKLLGKAARRAIESADALGVCSISGWELATLVRKKRLELDRPVAEWVALALAEARIDELTASAEIAVMAGSFGEDFHGDPCDRLIAATCLFHGAPLVTRDQALRAMPMLQPIW